MLKSALLSTLQFFGCSDQSERYQLQQLYDQPSIMVQNHKNVVEQPLSRHRTKAQENYNNHMLTFIRMIFSYTQPQQNTLHNMDLLTRTWANIKSHLAPKAQKELSALLNKVNIDPKNIKAEDMEKIFQFIEHEPEFQVCYKMLIPELTKKEFYKKYEDCYLNKCSKDCKKEIAKIVAFTVAPLSKDNPLNLFCSNKKKFDLTIIGPSIAYAGHPKHQTEKPSEL